MILAFSRTSAAFVALQKSVTRRDWKERTFLQWRSRIGTEQDAWSASPRFKGKPIGKFVPRSVTAELTRDIPDSDWEAEGFAYMDRLGINVGPDLDCEKLWRLWRIHPDLERSVIRFEITSIVEGLTPEMFWPDEVNP